MGWRGEKFEAMLDAYLSYNPTSPTSSDPSRIMSVTRDGIDRCHDWKGKRVLVLGCGDGYEVEYAREIKGWDAVGLTGLRGEMQLAQDRPWGSRVVYGDMHDLPFENNAFEAVYSKETLEHSACPILALLEINRVLRSGGEFFFMIPTGWAKQRDWYHLSCFPEYVWCDLFRKAYLDVSDCRSFPNCERAEMENVAYSGVKRANRPISESVGEYKNALNFSGF